MKKATIAIVGGGFCGTVAAIRLLASSGRGGPSLPFGSRVVLIEPGRPGAGLAYRVGPDYWRLNVPAGRMSAFPERPADFLEWARARDARVTAGDFLPRAWYGDYLAERLDLARRRSPRWLAFEQLATRATGIEIGGDGARIQLLDGGVLEADRVLLALGHAPASAPLPGVGDAVADPWDPGWIEDLPAYVPRVLIAGTGLTMIDMALAISEQRPDTRMLAISRHGLLPRPHETAAESIVPARRFDAAHVARGPLSARLRRFRAQAADGNWP
ncbi:MAG: FAD/NAD(P)-binding protein, partial [Steroidobacteraceae bacterium]